MFVWDYYQKQSIETIIQSVECVKIWSIFFFLEKISKSYYWREYFVKFSSFHLRIFLSSSLGLSKSKFFFRHEFSQKKIKFFSIHIQRLFDLRFFFLWSIFRAPIQIQNDRIISILFQFTSFPVNFVAVVFFFFWIFNLFWVFSFHSNFFRSLHSLLSFAFYGRVLEFHFLAP